jgi:FdhD protein
MVKDFNLSDEVPVSIFVNGECLATLMCTPEDLQDLALGHLLNAGLISGKADITGCSVCKAEKEVYVSLNKVVEKGTRFSDVITTACGQGTDYLDVLDEMSPLHSGYEVTTFEIRQSFVRMIKESKKYIRHGGVHSSALVTRSTFITREDVARHNSHDKVTGRGLLEDVDFSESMIITTGRISADMVFKARNAGVPIICSLSNPTLLAVQIADRFGITVIGRSMGKDMTVYTQDQRINNKELRLCFND